MHLRHRSGPAAVLLLPVLLLLGLTPASSAQNGQPQAEPFAGPSGPQQANNEGRTELPMVVRRSISFREIGPAISGGRVTAVAGIPGKPGIYYVGAADGGIFRTDDGGVTWKALFQHQDVLSIGALAVDPVNPGVIWAGTGEANVRNDVSFGDGIYKSTDGGAHWKHLGLEQSFQISRIVIDPHHPDTVLVAAMGSPWADSEDRGVYRTTDGGATWQKVLYLGPAIGISDLAMNPENPQILFAGAYRYRRTPWSYSDGGPEDAIYKSIDGGTTWRRLSGHGLPEKPVTRIGLAIAPSEPNIVYAVIGSDEGVLWRSDDSGEHWDMVSKDQEVDVRAFYFSHIAVDPKDPNHVIALSNEMMESKDGGRSFHAIAHQIHGDHHAIWIDPEGSGRIIEGNDGGVAMSTDNAGHWAFVHNLAIGQFYHVSPGSGPFYLVCGGLQDNSAWCGPARSKDPSGILDRMWFTLNGGDGMFAIQAADNPDLFYNSTQNGVWATWDRASRQSQDMEPYPRDISGAGVADLPYRFAWDAGFAVSPQNPQVLYAGGNVLFKSEDRGRTWKPISPDLTRNDKTKQQSSGGPVMKDNSGAEVYDAILSVTPAESDAKVIWVGTDDGVVQVTRDGGATWKNVTANLPNLPEWGRIESIDVAPDNPGEACIAVDRHFSGDFKPYLFRTADYGATWTSIAGNLPGGVYAHVVRRDRRNSRLYYAGLENGLYVSWDAGDHWYLFGLGLPNASVYDIALDAQQNSLVVGTHGRSIWVLDDLTPFQKFTPEIGQEAAHLFALPDAVRFWGWSQVEALGDGAFYGKNPPDGATLSYFVAHDVKEPGTLVITDAEGHVVRTLKGTHPLERGEAPPEEGDLPPAAGAQPPAEAAHPEQQEAKPAQPPASSQTQQQPPPKATGAAANPEAPKETPWVPTQEGLQRFTWDLRADGPVRWEAGKSFLKGPRAGAVVPPGTYTAKLTIDGKTMTGKLNVVEDPAAHADKAGIEERYRDSEAILHEVSQLDVALNRIDAINAQIGALRVVVKGTPDEKAVGDAIDSLEKQMKAAQAVITSNPGAAESTLRVPDMIHEHLLALSGGFEGEDGAPTAAMLDQMKLLRPEYEAALAKFNDFLKTDVPAFNRSMTDHKLTGVVAGEPVQP
ncbi:MAG TPA: hypothetical protein VHX37_04650 [Acidobacteriaceae bacterium]|jgi:photosystem II stability/assembly factor-like uncharacterized protein|nr:hypothetical protein [Acidobacteriaceae bacterium]